MYSIIILILVIIGNIFVGFLQVNNEFHKDLLTTAKRIKLYKLGTTERVENNCLKVDQKFQEKIDFAYINYIGFVNK